LGDDTACSDAPGNHDGWQYTAVQDVGVHLLDGNSFVGSSCHSPEILKLFRPSSSDLGRHARREFASPVDPRRAGAASCLSRLVNFPKDLHVKAGY
jgi:hypothetical protein